MVIIYASLIAIDFEHFIPLIDSFRIDFYVPISSFLKNFVEEIFLSPTYFMALLSKI
jgi:hypothetical protein